VSKNTALVELVCSENQLTYLNMRNGITEQLIVFHENYNSNLTCIEVLDPAWATANWTSANGNIDAGVTFSVICGGTDLTTWHVSTTGSDGSGNGTSASPLATIQTGINAATDGDTVLVAAGTYVDNINYNGKNIAVIGADRETTIIDGDQAGSVVTFNSGEGSTAVLSGFTIQNGKFITTDNNKFGAGISSQGAKPTLNNLIVKNNDGRGGDGGGIACWQSDCVIENVIVKENKGTWGGGISFGNASPVLSNVLVYSNDGNNGSAFFLDTASPTMNHVTITNNNGSPAVFILDNSKPIIRNSILHNNNSGSIYNEIYFAQNLGSDQSISISSSIVEGGQGNIITNGNESFGTETTNGTVVWGAGNIDVDPMFCDTLSYKYYDTSPAVGAGENGVNMGAMGVGCDVPQAFEWVSSALDTINITKTNLTDTYTAQWTESKDVYGDTIQYLLYAKIGVYPAEEIYDTTVTSVSITYQEIVENVFEGMPNDRATVRFSVSTTDGIDTVKVTGDDRVLFVNRYDYLSTEEGAIPTEFALHENYPNPFNPTTTLRFDLPEVSDATVTIYNMLGQKVRTFNMNDTPAGYHSIKWNATNDYGEQVGAGVYLYQLQAKDFVKTRKMVLLK
jgi:hypothetical protein